MKKCEHEVERLFGDLQNETIDKKELMLQEATSGYFIAISKPLLV